MADNEKTLLFGVLGMVAIVAIVGLILMITNTTYQSGNLSGQAWSRSTYVPPCGSTTGLPDWALEQGWKHCGDGSVGNADYCGRKGCFWEDSELLQ